MLGVQPQGEGKCSVGVQHSKLASPQAAEEAKAFWASKLDALVALLEGS